MEQTKAVSKLGAVKHYSFAEEIANSLSHGIGVILAALALLLLVMEATQMEDTLRVVSVTIYGISMIQLFLASTLYHAVPKPETKAVLQLIDHCAIYLLIAGSYTPFLLLTMGGGLGISLMVLIWTLAIGGILFKIFSNHRYHRMTLLSYLGMGWLALIGVYDIAMNLHWGGLALLIAGGVVFSLGTIFYKVDRIPFNHAIWHLFVLGGCLCHFLAIYFFVLPG